MQNKNVLNHTTISKTLIFIMVALAMMCAFVPQSAQAANTTTANTPTSTATEAWTFDYKTYSGADYPSASEPVVNGDYVYMAVDDKMLMINKSDGKIAKEADLSKSIGYTTRPVIVNDVIVMPENDGSLQAFKLGTLEVAWTLDGVKTDAQCCSTLTVDGNNVIFATVNVDFTAGTYTDGYLTCVNASTGVKVWQNYDASEGYYWDGGAIKGDYFVISGRNGTVKVFNKDTGDQISKLSLGTTVNSDVVFNESGDQGYIITRDGTLHILTVDSAGSVTSTQTKDLSLSGCACTPTISGGKLYVGGEIQENSASALAIVNLTTFETQLVETADNVAFGAGGVKGAPLVATNASGTYVYFTVNNATTTDYVTYTAGGGVYSYKVGDAQAKSIYDAKDHYQYCDSPVTCDTDGNLYYINDSGTLFKLQQGTADMHRLYNKYTGEHFYTASDKEKSDLINVGWTDEGVGWTAPTTSSTPVYRLYNKYAPGGDHHFTTSTSERDLCILAGWTDEGIGWYSDDAKGVEIYRQYNPFAESGTHNYTKDKSENDNLVSLGWKAEGTAWYGVK